MRFPLAALFLVIGSFIFFVMWAVTSFLLSAVGSAMAPLGEGLSTSNYSDMLNLLPWAFGIICAIFFVSAILVVFVLESLSEEPEYYYRR